MECATERFPGTLRLHSANFLLLVFFFHFGRKNKNFLKFVQLRLGEKRPSNISLLCPSL